MANDNSKSIQSNRPVAFYVLITFMSLSVLLFLMGQTLAVFDYSLAVNLGLQEDERLVSEFGVQLNRAFGASDTLVYIPFMVSSIIGLWLKKRWALFTSAAVMGISLYWATTIAFVLLFLECVANYSFVPGIDYWVFIFSYIIFGFWGIYYLIYQGESLIRYA